MSCWEVVYGDGSIFTDEDGGPEMAPRLNVMAVLQESPQVGIEILWSSDGRWFWRWGRWWGSDIPGCHTYRTSSVGEWCLELEGAWVPDDQWRKIQALVKERKNAWHLHERRVK